MGLVATSPLPSRGSPTLSQRGTKKAHLAQQKKHNTLFLFINRVSLAASRGPTSGRKCYATPAFFGVPKQGEKIRTGSPLPSQGPTRGHKCYVSPTFSRFPKQGDKITRGCLTLAFSAAHKWAEVLRNPCILRGPQTREQNHKELPHPYPLGAQKTAEVLRNPCILKGPQTRGQNQKWLPHPCLLRGPQEGGSATQPLHSQGSPNKGTKSEVVASPLPSQGPTSGRKCYVTLAFSRVPKQGDKIRSGRLIPAFSRGHKKAEMLCIPCILRGPQTRGQNHKGLPHPYLLGGPPVGQKATQPLHSQGSPNKGTKSEVATSPLPSEWSARRQKCYVFPAFSGVPKQGDKMTRGRLTPTFSGAHKRAEVLRNPCILRGPQTRGHNQKWLPHPCLVRGPQVGGIATQPLHSQSSLNKGTKSTVVTPAFSGAHKLTDLLRDPCILTAPKQGDKITRGCPTPVFLKAHEKAEVLRNPCIIRVPKQGDKIRKGCLTLAFSEAHKRAEVLCNPCILTRPQTKGQNHKGLPHPCLLGGPQVGGTATQPLHSQGSPNKGTKSQGAASPLPSRGPTRGRNCFVTPAFSRVPKQGDKIKSGCLTPAFSEAHKWAEVLRNPCILGGPQTRGQNRNWLPHPCLLRGPQVGGSARSPLHSRGSPNKGTKSELVASPLPSRGPTSGWKCYVTLAFSRDKIRRGMSKKHSPLFFFFEKA